MSDSTMTSSSGKHGMEALVYTLFAVMVLLVFRFFSDGDASAFITLGAAIQTLAFLMLFVKMQRTGSASGISVKSLQISSLTLMLRLSCTCVYNGYLPEDTTGQHVYQLCELSSLVLCLVLLARMHTTHASSCNKEGDSCAVRWMIIAAFVIGFVAHGRLNYRRHANVFWMSALWLEGFAMVPQIWMMAHSGETDAFTGHWVGCSFISRVVAAAFWMSVYEEFDYKVTWNYPGYSVCLAYVLQVLLGCDFMWHYAKMMMQNVQSSMGAGVSFSV